MPRYHFNLVDHKNIEDEEGHDLRPMLWKHRMLPTSLREGLMRRNPNCVIRVRRLGFGR